MGIAAIWAGVVLVLGALIIWRIDRYSNNCLELTRQQQRAAEEGAAIERMERQTAAELAERTLDQTVQLERARLLREAAEQRAAAAVAEDESLVNARIDEEQQVIAARAQGRAAAAKERALREGDNTSPIAVLTAAYLQARREAGVGWTFHQWLGTTRNLPE